MLYLWTFWTFLNLASQWQQNTSHHFLKWKLPEVCVMPRVLPSRSLAPGRKGLSCWRQGAAAAFTFCFEFLKSVCDVWIYSMWLHAGKHPLKSILLVISFICHHACCKPECGSGWQKPNDSWVKNVSPQIHLSFTLWLLGLCFSADIKECKNSWGFASRHFPWFKLEFSNISISQSSKYSILCPEFFPHMAHIEQPCSSQVLPPIIALIT